MAGVCFSPKNVAGLALLSKRKAYGIKGEKKSYMLLKKRQVISFSLSRYNIFTGCPQAKTCTLILRGGAEQFIEETERSLHDAIMIVRRAIKNDAVVAGGGAIEMELSKYLRDYSRSIAGKEQLLIGVMARALEIIPRQLCDNAGFDATNILNKLRQKHFQGKELSWLISLLNFRCCLILTHFVSMKTVPFQLTSYQRYLQLLLKKTVFERRDQ